MHLRYDTDQSSLSHAQAHEHTIHQQTWEKKKQRQTDTHARANAQYINKLGEKEKNTDKHTHMRYMYERNGTIPTRNVPRPLNG